MQATDKKELVENVASIIAVDLGVEVLELAVMPDHVHIIVRCFKPTNPSYLLFRFKGRISYEMFKEHPNFRLRYKKGHFWSRGNFCRTIGADIETERDYVRNQTDIHQTKMEAWAN